VASSSVVIGWDRVADGMLGSCSPVTVGVSSKDSVAAARGEAGKRKSAE
jgi:hypothetical protein